MSMEQTDKIVSKKQALRNCIIWCSLSLTPDSRVVNNNDNYLLLIICENRKIK